MSVAERVLQFVLSALLSVQAVLPGQTVDANLTVNSSQHFQTIDGFGVNANARSWNNGQLAPALDTLVDDMGATIFRVILERSDWQPSPTTTDPSIYESPKLQNVWGTIGYLNSKHALVTLNLMGTIPDWMGGASLPPDQEDHWVDMVVSLVSYARNVRHLQINLLSPMNEEDLGAPEGPRVGPEQYVRLLDKLSASLTAAGIDDVHLVGPDTASPATGASTYAPLMLDDPQLMARLDHVSIHAYSGDTGLLPAILGQSAYADRGLWITEWSAWCQGCDNGQSVRAEWDFASMTTDQLLDHLEHGASAALVYEGYDSFYEHHEAFSYWGQLAYDASAGTYTPRQRFYTNAQVFRYVRPGMVRLDMTSSDGRVRALIFQDPRTGDVTIVGHNANRIDLNLTVALAGLQLPSSPLRLVQTTNSASLVPGPEPAFQDGSVKATVAGDAFFTLTSVPEKAPLSANNGG